MVAESSSMGKEIRSAAYFLFTHLAMRPRFASWSFSVGAVVSESDPRAVAHHCLIAMAITKMINTVKIVPEIQ
jgi:hypothetical protein